MSIYKDIIAYKKQPKKYDCSRTRAEFVQFTSLRAWEMPQTIPEQLWAIFLSLQNNFE